MIDFSSSLSSKGLPTTITSQGDIDAVMAAFKQDLEALKFWQYYVLDVDREKTAVRAALSSAPAWKGPDVAGRSVADLANIIRELKMLDETKKFHERFQVLVDPEVAASLTKAAFTELTDNDALADAWVRIVDVLNVALYQEWTEDTRVALDNIKNRVTYTRLDEHGPKLGPITTKCAVLFFIHCVADLAVDCLLLRLTSRVSRRISTILVRDPSPTTAGSGLPTPLPILPCRPQKHTSGAR